MAFANTASLSTDLNVDPYYDDFDETKNFHRILFRPGLAVQARELTQLQTMLQNQIDRFGEHIFKEGSTVRGLEMNYDRVLPFVKLRDADQTGATVNTAAFIGSELTGGTTGVKAFVVDALEGAEANNPNMKTLYIKYISSGTTGTTAAFASGEVLTSNTSLQANVVTSNSSVTPTGTGSRIDFAEGIFYAKDHFIRVPQANSIVGRYDANTNVKIGFVINETQTTSDTDTTLLDPAQGSFNFAAPGANRLKLTPVLTVKNLTDEDLNFVERARIKNGELYAKQDKPMYSVINEYIARRTHDESGDYIVKGLFTKVREHLNTANNGGIFTAPTGDTNKLAIKVAPGKAYIKGYETELTSSRVAVVDKATDFESVDDIPITVQYGNFVQVNEVSGAFDITGHDVVSLYNTPFNSISNSSFGSSSITGRTKIGEARVRALEHSSGEKGDNDCVYNMYLYDINMTANNISAVRGIYFDNGAFDGVADTVVTTGNTVLSDTKFNRGVFEIPASNIKTIRESDGNTIDNDFIFQDGFDVTIAAAGTVTVTTDGSDEIFNLSTGAVSDANKKSNFQLVLKGTATSAGSLGSATISNQGHTISMTGAATKLNVGEVVSVAGYSNTFTINSVATNSITTHERGLKAVTGNLTKSFQAGQVINLSGVGGDAASRSVTINSTTQATIDLQETLASGVTAKVFAKLKKQNGREIAKTINESRFVELNISQGHSNTSVGSPGTSGPFNLGLSDGHKLRSVRLKTGNTFFANTTEGTDVTTEFLLDTGMTDNLYGHSKLKLKGGSTHLIANGNVYLVELDFFTHDTSSGVGYFSVDSYPIDDTNTANTTAIQTAEIPIYESKTTGERFDLRNCIDIRPRITDTANNVAVGAFANITRNPALSTEVVEPTSGLRYPAPDENFTIDFQYYLPRRDRILITKTGAVQVVKGVPSLDPRTPGATTEGMTIAIVDVKPFPSLPQENAARIRTATAPNGRPDVAIRLRPKRIRRYTMKDIMGLEERIDNLEYYTSLSLLEADTKSLFLVDGSGVDRFKNGIIVDQFVDFTSSDFFNEGYAVSLDRKKKEARPSFKVDDVQFEFLSANSTNATVRSKDATVTISTSGTYSNGETISQGSTNGKLVYQVGDKLYIENVTGAFTTSANVVGGTSSTSRAVSTVATPNDGKLVTLPYTHDLAIEQNFASTTRNTAGLFYNFRGLLQLNPETDYWQDITTAPAVQIDFGNFADALENIANAVGTQFGEFSTFSVDTDISAAGITTVTNQRREGTKINVNRGRVVETDLGESIQDLNIIPHMRSREIQVTASGMKPSTKLFAFFDDENVTAFISPANSTFGNTASEGSDLITDSEGVARAIFRLPNNDQIKFLNGNLKLRLSDSPTNSREQGLFTTSAEAVYSASGMELFKQGAVITTRDISITTEQVFETRSVSSFSPAAPQTAGNVDDNGDAGDDPIAQSFRVDDGIGTLTTGVFLTKLDLYFRTKDPNLPIQLEIVEVDPESSYLTNRVVPFSEFEVPAADINVSSDASAPTPIIFETPIYLVRGEQYAFKITPAQANPNYTVWAAKLGETDTLTNNRIVKQPASGTMFASSNDLGFSPVQTEDIKYRMYFADFGTNKTGTAVFKNVDKEYFTLANTDNTSVFNRIGETVHGESTITFTSQPSANAGLSLLSISGSGAGANGIVTFKSANTARVKEVTLANKFQAGDTVRVMNTNGSATGTTAVIHSVTTPTGKVYFFDNQTQANTFVHLEKPTGNFAANTFLRGQVSGLDARIKTVENLPADMFETRVSKLVPETTAVSATAKFAAAPGSLDTTFRVYNLIGETIYADRKFIHSRSNEIANLSSKKSGEIRMTLTNGGTKQLSPAIDNDRSAVLTIENLINNDSTNETTSDKGNALARYVMRTVTLDDGQDAEDLKVFCGAYKPSTATIEVFGKFLNGEDGQNFDDKTWIKLTQVTPATIHSDSENQEDFEEFEFTVPTASLTGDAGELQYTTAEGVTFTGFKRFKIKVVLLSTSTSRVPRIRDLRAVALQI